MHPWILTQPLNSVDASMDSYTATQFHGRIHGFGTATQFCGCHPWILAQPLNSVDVSTDSELGESIKVATWWKKENVASLIEPRSFLLTPLRPFPLTPPYLLDWHISLLQTEDVQANVSATQFHGCLHEFSATTQFRGCIHGFLHSHSNWWMSPWILNLRQSMKMAIWWEGEKMWWV
jgi:hypothetical protein